jgi:hypothetical protein
MEPTAEQVQEAAMTDREPDVLRPSHGCEDLEEWARDDTAAINAHGVAAARDAGQPGPGVELSADESAWDALRTEVAEALDGLGSDQFLILEYHPSGTIEPYAQAAREVGGYYCELVSEAYLPSVEWPIDEIAIRRQGWTPPDPDTQNWWTVAESADLAARLLVDGLRHGRRCDELSAFTWRDGTFPGGGGDGGEPLPEPEGLAA